MLDEICCGLYLVVSMGAINPPLRYRWLVTGMNAPITNPYPSVVPLPSGFLPIRQRRAIHGTSILSHVLEVKRYGEPRYQCRGEPPGHLGHCLEQLTRRGERSRVMAYVDCSYADCHQDRGVSLFLLRLRGRTGTPNVIMSRPPGQFSCSMMAAFQFSKFSVFRLQLQTQAPPPPSNFQCWKPVIIASSQPPHPEPSASKKGPLHL